jgi:hypothetical protein
MTTTAATRQQHGLRGSEDGATAVEAAFVLSVFVLMVLGIVYFGQAFFTWNRLQLVVGQASRYVIVQTSIPNPPGSKYCPPASPPVSCAISALTTLLPDASSNCTGAPAPDQYCVDASCTATTCSLSALYGFKFGSLYTLTGQITVPIGLLPD